MKLNLEDIQARQKAINAAKQAAQEALYLANQDQVNLDRHIRDYYQSQTQPK